MPTIENGCSESTEVGFITMDEIRSAHHCQPADIAVELPALLQEFSSIAESSSSSHSVRRSSVHLGNDKSHVPEIVDGLAEDCLRCGLITEAEGFKIRVALEEAILNAIIHGNLEVSSTLRECGDDSFESAIRERQQCPKYRDRKVKIDCQLCRSEARFTITDQGKGFDVSAIPNPTDDDYLERPCGRGMLLMRAFMDSVEYNATGNSVTLVKNAVPQTEGVE